MFIYLIFDELFEGQYCWCVIHLWVFTCVFCIVLFILILDIFSGANLLAVNAEGNMPYDICDEESTLDFIESEMAKRGVTQELIEEIRALPETKMLQDMQLIQADGGDLEYRDAEGATYVRTHSFVTIPYFQPYMYVYIHP